MPGTEVSMTLKPGDTLGRYGNIGEKSNFVTQTGADASKLALPPNTDPAVYQESEVIKKYQEQYKQRLHHGEVQQVVVYNMNSRCQYYN